MATKHMRDAYAMIFILDIVKWPCSFSTVTL